MNLSARLRLADPEAEPRWYSNWNRTERRSLSALVLRQSRNSEATFVLLLMSSSR